MPLLFAVTLFVSAALLFCVQPMIAKMILPLLGGSPAVWNTCMVFFQAALLAGYAYAHVATAWLGLRLQTALHAGLLLLPVLFKVLPMGIPEEMVQRLPTATTPIPWLLGLLVLMVGLPFFVVSTSGPLLQKWFAGTGHVAGKDPYFLYAASNLGSMLALVSYPLLLEPNLPLDKQSTFWAAGYGLLVVLTLLCAAAVWFTRPRAGEGGSVRAWERMEEAAALSRSHAPTLPHSHAPTLSRTDAPTLSRRLRWILLAFVPSSLMLGVTTYLSTDIAAIPLMWVIPLALYLLTFILVFARRTILPLPILNRVLPFLIVLLVFVMILRATQPIWALTLLHLATFFVAAMICHGKLAEDRPSPAYLTEFYLWLSVGGVLGGLFNALLAPVVFWGVVEYPLALVLACLLRPRTSAEAPSPSPLSSGGEGKGEGPAHAPTLSRSNARMLDFVLPVLVGAGAVGIALSIPAVGLRPDTLVSKLLLALPAILAFTFAERPVRFALGIGALLLANAYFANPGVRTLHVERNFFGVLTVLEDNEGYRRMDHGSTVHGRQSLDPSRRSEPLSYYHRTGPLGQVFDEFNRQPDPHPALPRIGGGLGGGKVALVGLGAGAAACYAEPHQDFIFYEIDPAVERIARDERYFTYMKDCRARELKVVLGDARLRLAEAPDKAFGLIVLDAFSSDAIPVHLLTRQALELYLSKLEDGGLLAFHVSNNYVDLQPVLDNIARDLRYVCRANNDQPKKQAEYDEWRRIGKDSSTWVVMARNESDLGKLASHPAWKAVSPRPDLAVWTDDFSNILSVFIWN